LNRASQVVRVILLSTVIAVSVGVRGADEFPYLLSVAAAAGFAAAISERSAGVLPVVAVTLEGAVAAVCVVGSGGADSPLLPYLLAPAFALGCLGSLPILVVEAFVVTATIMPGLVLVTDGSLRDPLTTASQWLVLSMAAGGLGLWGHRLLEHRPAEAPYDSAHRLISQLRIVSRKLPGGLDVVPLATSIATSVRDGLGGVGGVGVYATSGGDRLTSVARLGMERGLPWRIELDEDDLAEDVWTTQQPRDALSDEGVRRLAIPLVLGVRTVALIVATVDGPPAAGRVAAVMREIQASALRLETALLFREVRDVATVEERRRLAREIHDGIAQEIASLGYIIDDLAARARRQDTDLEPRLTELRSELTRIVRELRLSIFELRADVQGSTSLGSALSSYVQEIGSTSSLRVHLSLDEAAGRLNWESEAELLRIAQEAIGNARRHASATNLWVTAVIDPPRALLRIEDDGSGMGAGRHDSYGLEIMQERAARLGAEFIAENRAPRGTRIEVVMGGDEHRGRSPESAARRSVASGREAL
jgi:signal transduction histidine kinase